MPEQARVAATAAEGSGHWRNLSWAGKGGGEDMNSLWAEYAWETVAFLSESLRSHRQ